MQELRVFFVGDELVAGKGDARALGWVGRIIARTPLEPPITAITLAFPGENTGQLTERWEGEVLPRLNRDATNRLVIGLGSRDLDAGLSSARSRLHLANLLDNAERRQLSPFVVGPPPRADMPVRRVEELSHAYADVCARRSVPYVETFAPLVNHEQWNTDMSVSGGYTPHQAGYGLMAWLVLHRGWHQWLGVNPASFGE
ncbi:GDSL-type esterase/lipase family protein [Arcanobacterium bovis]|uniref:Lysophospholipase n=1 Tax=Arcanobacterium bovis TaxID=2529275 RepID=A0A4Q9V1J5_9ACTO|nr:GDSL-type esterase/lipase family protein [Arcanobacterium bovis]TBW21551.1 lysophospholipase [Arcanobacterium bovis]